MFSSSAVSSSAAVSNVPAYHESDDPPTEEDFLTRTDSKVQKAFQCKNAELRAIWKKFDYAPDNLTHKIIRIIEETGIPKFTHFNRSLRNERERIENITLDDLKDNPAKWGIDGDGRLFVATKRLQSYTSDSGIKYRARMKMETFYQSESHRPNDWQSYPKEEGPLVPYYLIDQYRNLFPLFEKLLKGEEIEFKCHGYKNERNSDYRYIFKAKLAKKS